MPVQELVTLEEFKRHLRLPEDLTEQDDDLTLKLKLAQEIVLDYIAREDEDWTAEIAAWTNEDVPGPVQAAILVQGAELFRFRGDSDAPQRDVGDLAPLVKSYLRRYRDPVVR
jgi:hypothetical protein